VLLLKPLHLDRGPHRKRVADERVLAARQRPASLCLRILAPHTCATGGPPSVLLLCLLVHQSTVAAAGRPQPALKRRAVAILSPEMPPNRGVRLVALTTSTWCQQAWLSAAGDGSERLPGRCLRLHLHRPCSGWQVLAPAALLSGLRMRRRWHQRLLRAGYGGSVMPPRGWAVLLTSRCAPQQRR
jgi:hypothetical protein